jgi:hypothetical protein
MSFAAEGTSVWRLPAAEIETLVIGEVGAMLRYRVGVWEMGAQFQPEWSWSMADRSKLAKMAGCLSLVPAGDDASATRDTIFKLVASIEPAADTVTIALSSAGLRTALRPRRRRSASFGQRSAPTDHTPLHCIAWGETKLVPTQDGNSGTQRDHDPGRRARPPLSAHPRILYTPGATVIAPKNK